MTVSFIISRLSGRRLGDGCGIQRRRHRQAAGAPRERVRHGGGVATVEERRPVVHHLVMVEYANSQMVPLLRFDN